MYQRTGWKHDKAVADVYHYMLKKEFKQGEADRILKEINLWLGEENWRVQRGKLEPAQELADMFNALGQLQNIKMATEDNETVWEAIKSLGGLAGHKAGGAYGAIGAELLLKVMQNSNIQQHFLKEAEELIQHNIPVDQRR